MDIRLMVLGAFIPVMAMTISAYIDMETDYDLSLPVCHYWASITGIAGGLLIGLGV